jgi:phosphoglycolate phosphatase-like HAD superfamily hydrolase
MGRHKHGYIEEIHEWADGSGEHFYINHLEVTEDKRDRVKQMLREVDKLERRATKEYNRIMDHAYEVEKQLLRYLKGGTDCGS